MKILIDTNILVDYLSKREPFIADANAIINLCGTNKFQGYVAAHSITDCFYVMRKTPADERKKAILNILMLLTVIGIDEPKLLAALNDPNFNDIEDCLQAVCAADLGLDYIVTRNIKDFAGNSVLPITPSEFLFKLNN